MPSSLNTHNNLTYARESLLLAPYATHSAKSLGRKYPESHHPYRGPFQRDRDRLIHSVAYRRLSGKTQVFTGEMGDYHRTRLTHTLEVASIARTLARALRLNEDLVETLALAHDIGHPPFGHAGEETLNECLLAHGGFNHNLQAIRIVEVLETRYRSFSGLNLSLEVLEGQATRAEKNCSEKKSPVLEAQLVEAADSIAYDTHDADDALELELVDLPELLTLPLWKQAAQRVQLCSSNLTKEELRHCVVHELIDWQVGDLLATTEERIARLQIDSIEAVRTTDLLIRPNEELLGPKLELEKFLHKRVYRHPSVLAMRTRAQLRLHELFDHYREQPTTLPTKFIPRVETEGLERSVADHLASMTDQFVFQEHQRLFSPKT